MKKLIASLLAICFLVSSCASHHSGSIATTEEVHEERIVVSAEKIEELSDAKNTMIVFTFENKRGYWTRFKNATFSCGEDCDNETNVILGSDLRAWSQSQYIKKTIAQYNDGLMYAGFMVIGLVAAAAGANQGNEGVMNAGLATYSGAAGMATYDAVKEAQLQTKLGQVDSNSDHIYNPFAVPAAGYAKKWILVNTPKNNDITKIHLSLETVDGEMQNYAIEL